MSERPWFKLWVADWLGDTLLRSCSLGARGLLIDLICIMHEADPYGHLLINGQPVTDFKLSVLLSVRLPSLLSKLRELETKKVLSRNEAGVLFSRKMVKMAQESAKHRENGRKGGHPALVNQVVNGGVKPKKQEAISKKEHTSKLAFDGDVLTVFGWQHKEFSKRLTECKRTAFDLLGWYPAVDADIRAMGLTLPADQQGRNAWLLDRLYTDAKLPRNVLPMRDREPAPTRQQVQGIEATRKMLEKYSA